MRDNYPHQDSAPTQRSLMERISQSRFVQVGTLGTALFGLGACGSPPTPDDNGRGDAVPGVQLKSQVLILANADTFPNTSIQCVTDTVIFSNTRAGGPQTIVPNQPDLCDAVATTLRNHPSLDGKAVQVDHLDCPAEPVNLALAQKLQAHPDFGLC